MEILNLLQNKLSVLIKINLSHYVDLRYRKLLLTIVGIILPIVIVLTFLILV